MAGADDIYHTQRHADGECGCRTIPPASGQPEGECFLFTAACGGNGVPAYDIGPTCGPLSGLAYPGASDRPFRVRSRCNGQFGISSTQPDYADYYAITYRPLQPCPPPPSTVSFSPVPPASLGVFTRPIRRDDSVSELALVFS